MQNILFYIKYILGEMAFYNGDTDSDTVVAIQYTSICFSHDITERKELMHSNVILSSFQ